MTGTETSKIPPVIEAVRVRIANASLVAIFSVVLLHVVLECFPPPATSSVCLFLRDFARFAVPFFFLVSGYLLAGHSGETGWWRQETTKRIRTLVMPYFLWSALFGLYLLLGSAFSEGLRTHAFDLAAWWSDKQGVIFGMDLWKPPLMLPLWFLRTLFLLVLLSGVLSWSIRRFGKAILLVLGILYLVYAVLVDVAPLRANQGLLALLRMTFAPEAFFYFALGLWLRQRGVQLPIRRATPFLLLAAGILSLRFFLGSWVPYPLVIPFALFGVWYAVPDTPWPKALTSLVFPVYLMHWFFVHAVSRACLVPDVKAVAVPLTFFFVLAASVGLAVCLRRFSPSLAGLLFGGR